MSLQNEQLNWNTILNSINTFKFDLKYDLFKELCYNLNQINENNEWSEEADEPFYTSIISYCTLKINNELTTYTYEQILDLQKPCEAILKYYLKLSQLKAKSVTNIQILSLIECFVQSTTTKSHNIDLNSLLSTLNRSKVPDCTSLNQLKETSKSKESTIIDMMNTFIVQNFNQNPKDLKDYFYKANLKWLSVNDALSVLIASSLSQLNEYQTSVLTLIHTNDDYKLNDSLDLRSNFNEIQIEIDYLNALIKLPIVHNSHHVLTGSLFDLILTVSHLIPSICVLISTATDDNVQPFDNTFISNCVKIYDDFCERHSLYVNSASLHIKSAILLRNLISSIINSTPAANKTSNNNKNADFSLICMKFIQTLNVLFKSTDATDNRNKPASQDSSSMKADYLNDRRFYDFLFDIFYYSFLKCQNISIEFEQDTKDKLLSFENLQLHNSKQQQIERDVAAVTPSVAATHPNEATPQPPAQPPQDSIKDIDESSEDSEYLLLAPWFDEQQHQQQPTSLTQHNTTQTHGTALADLSTTSTHILDTTFELDSNQTYSRYIDVMMETMGLFESIIYSDNFNIDQLRQSIANDKQIHALAFYLREIETKCERLPERFINSYLKFIKILIFKDILTHKKQNHLLDCLGLKLNEDTKAAESNWPLYINKRILAVVCQMFAFRFKDKDDGQLRNEIVTVWRLFLSSLKSKVIKRNTECINEDVNVEHLELLLFLFHQLPLLLKRSILIQVSQAIIDTTESIAIVQTYPPLLISRLMVVFDYLLRNFYEPSTDLLDRVSLQQQFGPLRGERHDSTYQGRSYSNLKIKENFLATSDPTTQQPQPQQASPNTIVESYVPCDGTPSTSSSTLIQPTGGSTSMDTNLIASLNKYYQAEADQTRITTTIVQFKPKFYLFLKSRQSTSYETANELKLDGIALNLLLTGLSKEDNVLQSIDYNRLYSALLKLLNVGFYVYDFDEWHSQFTLEEYTAIPYTFFIVWRLLSNLPPSIDFISNTSPSAQYTHNQHIHYLRTLQKYTSTVNTTSDLEEYLTKQDPKVNAITLIQGLIHRTETSLSVDSFLNYWSTAIIDTKTSLTRQNEVNFLLNVHLLNYHLSSMGRQTLVADANEDLIQFLICLIRHYGLLLKQKLSLHVNLSFLNNGLNTNSKAQLNTGCLLNIDKIIPKHLLGHLNSFNNAQQQQQQQQQQHQVGSAMTTSFSYKLKLLNLNSAIAQLLNDLLKFLIKSNGNQSSQSGIQELFIELNSDYILSQVVSSPIKDYFANSDLSKLQSKFYSYTVACIYNLCVDYNNSSSHVSGNRDGDDQLLIQDDFYIDLLKFIDSNADNAAFLTGFCQFFNQQQQQNKDKDEKFLKFLLTISKFSLNSKYFKHILIILNKLFQKSFELQTSQSQAAAAVGLEDGLNTILRQVNHLADFNLDTLFALILQENDFELKFILQKFIRNLIQSKVINESCTLFILNSLIKLTNYDRNGFNELLLLMDILCLNGSGIGHLNLFEACCSWLEDIMVKPLVTATGSDLNSNDKEIESTYLILSFISNVLNVFKMCENSSCGGLNDLMDEHDDGNGDDDDIDIGLNGNENDLKYIDETEDKEDLDQEQEVESEQQLEKKDSTTTTCDHSGENMNELNLKLCTFTISKKEFMSQHWYYCHTCKMVDRIGCCTICAKVCHAGHDVSYAKYGSFFCDCGAKEDGTSTCQALKKRGESQAKPSTTQQCQSQATGNSKQLQQQQQQSQSNQLKQLKQFSDLASNHKYQHMNIFNLNLNILYSSDFKKMRQAKVRQIDGLKESIIDLLKSKDFLNKIKGFIDKLLTSKDIDSNYDRTLLNTLSSCLRNELNELKLNDKSIDFNEQLFIPTLGSQEGAFENVRMTYTGEHGQQIKQRINSHSLRRTSMCCLTSKTKKHLIVTHEKGKLSNITILQLNALLQSEETSTSPATKASATTSKRQKLTLTKLNTIQVPFVLVSIVANPLNEDYLALNGLKDCQIIYLNENGHTTQDLLNMPTAAATNTGTTTTGTIMLHTGLEGSNYIIKSQWLPGSQTELALVTNDFIKIYDLNEDSISPKYYFLLPIGKIRDCTFLYENNQRYILIISSIGYVYYEVLNTITSNGMYYITNTIDIQHEDIKESTTANTVGTGVGAGAGAGAGTGTTGSGIVNNGGVSIYYSFKLQMLFWSYHNARTFAASFKTTGQFQFANIFILNSAVSASATTTTNQKYNGNSTQQQALCNWSEIQSHPGLVLAMTLISNNPVAIMLTPDKIMYQEIRISGNGSGSTSTKCKIQDMVATRHPVSGGSNGEDDSHSSSGYNSPQQTPTERTTMIILCDDGSLKIYVADQAKTEYWLQTSFSNNRLTTSKHETPFNFISLYYQQQQQYHQQQQQQLQATHESTVEATTTATTTTTSTMPIAGDFKLSNLKFPIDFFEKCTQVNDIDVTGNELLEVYNAQQIKQRLLNSKSIACTKQNGFKLDITNKDANFILTGCRILCGGSALDKIPQTLQVNDRIVACTVNQQRQRWYDICLTRTESYTCDGKMSVVIGKSSDPNFITIIDAIKVYGMSKELFNWTNEEYEASKKKRFDEKILAATTKVQSDVQAAAPQVQQQTSKAQQQLNLNDIYLTYIYSNKKATKYDLILKNSLDILEYNLLLQQDIQQDKYTLDLCFKYLTFICPKQINLKLNTILYSILSKNKKSYLNIKDSLQLKLILNTLKSDCLKEQIDFEAYLKILFLLKLIIIHRPMNLIKFFTNTDVSQDAGCNLIKTLNDLFWLLYERHRLSQPIASIGCDTLIHGLFSLNQIIELLVEIMHYYLLYSSSNGHNGQVYAEYSAYFMRLLFCDDINVSFLTRKCLIYLLKAKKIKRVESVKSAAVVTTQSQNKPVMYVVHSSGASASATAPITPVPATVAVDDQILLPLLGNGRVVDEADVDEEEMMQIAMALSLSNNQDIANIEPQQLQNALDRAHNMINTATTTTTTPRLPPSSLRMGTGANVQQISQESSNDMSISEDEDFNLSNAANATASSATSRDEQQIQKQYQENKKDEEYISIDQYNMKLYTQRKQLLEHFIKYVNEADLDQIENGIKVIPYFQLILTLMSDLNSNNENDKQLLSQIIKNFLSLLIDTQKDEELLKRTAKNEIKLICLKTIIIILSKSKFQKDTTQFIVKTFISSLLQFNIIDICFNLLKLLFLNHWKTATNGQNAANIDQQLELDLNIRIVNGRLIKLNDEYKYLDEMSPYFTKETTIQAAQNQSIFSSYMDMLTELIIRLPYQLKKQQPQNVQFTNITEWTFYLCEYLLIPPVAGALSSSTSASTSTTTTTATQTQNQAQITQNNLNRLIKKLLQLLCNNSKDGYRKLRDTHIILNSMNEIIQICPLDSVVDFVHKRDTALTPHFNFNYINTNLVFTYNNLIKLVDNLKIVYDICLQRTFNWQQFCMDNKCVILYLIEISLIIDDYIVPIILQLLLCSFGGTKTALKIQNSSSTSSSTGTSSGKSSKSKDASSAKQSSSSVSGCKGGEENLGVHLINYLFTQIDRQILLKFIQTHLLDTNNANIRWLLHSLLYTIYKNTTSTNQAQLFTLIEQFWYDVPQYGQKAAQYIDLIGYCLVKSLNNTQNLNKYLSLIQELFYRSNSQLKTHSNSFIYKTISSFIEFDGFYLESNPCFTCNIPNDQQVQNLKLNAIKLDSRYTTNQQIYKLLTAYSITKIQIKLNDIKKTKMIQTLNVYYNNKSVQSVIELKNKPNIWLKAKQIHLQPNQSDIKIDFNLPITASNIMFEYLDFYENQSQLNTELLQCPRCSATVSAHPGVCNNCGENVFQCHKCRAINYDERDPFLCNSCGFCKFAKFDIAITGKLCYDIEIIENEEDRKKCLNTINGLLEKSDRLYKSLTNFIKPSLETLLIKLNEQSLNEKLININLNLGDPSIINAAPSANGSVAGIIGLRPPQPTTTTAAAAAASATPTAVSGQYTTYVNRTVQLIAQKYTIECKNTFDELSRIIQKLSLCRKELKEYDKQFITVQQQQNQLKQQRKLSICAIQSSNKTYAVNQCYGCAYSCIEHCIVLLRSLLVASSTVSSEVCNNIKNELCRNGVIEELVNYNLRNTLSLATPPAPPAAAAAPPSTTLSGQAAAQPTSAAATASSSSSNGSQPPPITAPSQPSTQLAILTPNTKDIINLIYLIIKDNFNCTKSFNKLILGHIDKYLSQAQQSPTIGSIELKHEILLLTIFVQKHEDLCWEQRLKLILQILIKSLNYSNESSNSNNAVIVETISLPCLRILNYMCKYSTTNIINIITMAASANLSKKSPSKSDLLLRCFSEPGIQQADIINFFTSNYNIDIDLNEFLLQTGDQDASYYSKWLRIHRFINENSLINITNYNNKNLLKKCFQLWLKTIRHVKQQQQGAEDTNGSKEADVLNNNWLKSTLFCTTSNTIRQLVCTLIQQLYNFNISLTQIQNTQALPSATTSFQKKFQIADLLVAYLNEVVQIPKTELTQDYLNLLKILINSDRELKYYLVLKKKILFKLESLLINQIRQINDDGPFVMSYGYTVLNITELLSQFLNEKNIKNKYKSQLLTTILDSYLTFKKLLYKRTKYIDDAQDKLLALLEDITCDTHDEKRKFIQICINQVKKINMDYDLITPVFLYERLCNIIYPENLNDQKEFFMVLEKDANQEDYLQGRMLGNPYSSNDASLEPLMRDIKNKICTDCELIALLDDDNGMELLVNNKIISLDLAVRDVYKKVWLTEAGNDNEPMKIVYRMTGLSGDATEDIIDNLDAKSKDQAKDDEDVYKMASELAFNDSLKVMLESLSTINETNITIGKPLLSVLLKLFTYALKLKINRKVLIHHDVNSITVLLQTLNLIFKIEKTEQNKIGVQLTEQLLNIIECILSESNNQQEQDEQRPSSDDNTEQVEFLMSNIKGSFVCKNQCLLELLMRIIPYLSYGSEKKMKALISYFKSYYTNFDYFNLEANFNETNEHQLNLECLCVIVNGIDTNENGKRLRDMMSDVVDECISYLLKYSPKITTYLNNDYDLWKEFLGYAILPYILRILTGLCRSHDKTQEAIGRTCIPLLHKLEQFSSGSARIGVLAEDLLVLLKTNKNVESIIDEVQTQTKNEKKKLAMAMRHKQLTQLGMKANEKGQLTIDSNLVKTSIDDDVEEEKGHTCRICREGYKYHPQKVLAIYTFSKKVDIEPYEAQKTRKTAGYSTVTHFNIVHIDCHSNAIRLARSNRDEWESATLLNANTKCNGLLPFWGPEVPETAFSNALARHNCYLLETTGIREATYTLSVHDLKLLLFKFAENLSFSEDTGGGGRESNICAIPYMLHMILYSINTAKYVNREERNMTSFFDMTDKLIGNSFEVDSVFYYMAMSLVIMKPGDWSDFKLKFLQRTFLTAHTRLVNTTSDKQRLYSLNLLDFGKYKPSLLYFGLVSLFHENLHTKIPISEQPWTETIANYLRNNDMLLLDTCKKILKIFEDELMVCEDWTEFIDVIGLLSEMPDPIEHFKAYLKNIK